MNVFTKQKQTHRHSDQTCHQEGGREEEGLGIWGWQMQTTALHSEWMNKILQYSTGNYIQSLGIKHNGKEC